MIRTLVIEDDELNRKLLVMLLQRLGLEATSVRDGATGLLAGEHGRFRLVILDLNLPDMSGTEVVRRLRALPGGAHMRILAVSGEGGPEEEGPLLAQGFDGFLPKPFTFEEFAARLKMICPDVALR